MHFTCPQSLILSAFNYSNDTLRPSALTTQLLTNASGSSPSVILYYPPSLIVAIPFAPSVHINRLTYRPIPLKYE